MRTKQIENSNLKETETIQVEENLKKKRTKTQTKTIFDILRQINAVTMKQRLEKVCKEQKDVLEIKNMLMMGKKKHNKILEDKIEKSPCQQKKKYEEMENRIKGLKKN